MNRIVHRTLLGAVLLGLVTAGACTDAPSAPDAQGGSWGQLAIAPQLSLKSGPATASSAAIDALREALSRVDRFQVVVKRLDGEVAANEEISVDGEPPFELSLSVTLTSPNEEFDLELTGKSGEEEMFKAGPLRVRAVPKDVQTEPTSVDAELEYTGPGSNATELNALPAVQLLDPEANGELQVSVLDEDGNELTGVPLAYSSSDDGVAQVSDDGTLTTGTPGAAQVTVSTPTGVSSSVWVYVAQGTLAFVREDRIWEVGVTSDSPTVVVDKVGAGQPTYSADGTTLVYALGGTIYDGQGTAVTSGIWPSFSPDGTKLAVERSGTVALTNSDGTHPTEGPTGSAPVWMPDGESLLVQGASLDEVSALDGSRSTVVEDAGAGPGTVTADGRVAYVDSEGAVRVGGADQAQLTPAGSASSRPAWSADGRLVVAVMDGALHLVPSDGAGPPIALPVGQGTDPAWRGQGYAQEAAPPSIESIEPAQPSVGDEVTVTGSGFDAIITTNNVVTFPGEQPVTVAGPQPVIRAEVLSVTPTSLTTVMPNGAESGELTVETFAGKTTATFQAAPGLLRVLATTGAGEALEGVTVRAVADSQVVASGTTGTDGVLELADLPADRYTLEVDPPDGYSFSDGPVDVSVLAGDTTEVSLTLQSNLVISPSEVEKLPGGTESFSVIEGPSGPYIWSVNDVDGGDQTYGTITTSGDYTAPETVPSPSTFPVCARVEATPSVEGCASVTIEPTPTAGEDVVVINDINFFDGTGLGNNDNRILVRNLVSYTSDGTRATEGTVVWWDIGRNSVCSSTCATSTMVDAVAEIESTGLSVVEKSTAQGDYATIPSEVKVIWMWTPTVAFTVDEVNALKSFAAEGGRIIFIGEHSAYYDPTYIENVENKFLADMGAEMTNSGAQIKCGFHTWDSSYMQAHQITDGMTTYTMACASEVIPGPNDFVLFFAPVDGVKVPIGGVAKIDTTPISSSPYGAPAATSGVVEPTMTSHGEPPPQ